MSGFFGIIFYVVVIGIFINAKKMAQREHNQGDRGKKLPTSTVSGKRNTVPPQVLQAGKSQLTKGAVSGNTTGAHRLAQETRKDWGQEAKKDNVWQSNQRKHTLWDEDPYAKQRSVALRLMEGDPVPEKYKRVKCPYCAADNLVVKGSKQYHSCYFCRVPID